MGDHPAAYTALAAAAVLAVLALELLVLRTGLLRQPRYWLAMAIIFSFQVLVDGWLTKPYAPVVHYLDTATAGIRAPWQIPVEDFGFGFALVTLVLLRWQRFRHRTAGYPVREQDQRGGHDAGTQGDA